MLYSYFLTTFRGSASGTDETAFLVDEGFLTTVGASLSVKFCAVGHVFFERAFNTHFPCVD